MTIARRDLDFIKLNGRAVKHANMKRSPSLTALDDLKKKQEDNEKGYKRGEVPKYLVQRQSDWQRQEAVRQASLPDPELPEGHKLLPNNERLDTLAKLKQTQTDLLQQLNSMPIRTDTVRMRSKKEELERKLSEIEEATKIFSRPKVFVRLDS